MIAPNPRRGVTRACVRDLRRARAHALVGVHTSDLDRTLRLVRGLVRVRVRTHDLGHALQLAHALDRDVDRYFDLDLDPALARALIRVRVQELDRVRVRVGIRDLVREWALQLAEQAFQLIHTLTGGNLLNYWARWNNGVVVWPTGRLLVFIATRLLPRSDRERYVEEFESELWDLAEARAGWWRQTAYAFRLLVRAVHLRFVLKAPRRSRVKP